MIEEAVKHVLLVFWWLIEHHSCEEADEFDGAHLFSYSIFHDLKKLNM